MKLFKSTKEPEIFYYYNSKKDKLWMFRHKYYDSAGKRKEKKKSGFKSEKEALKALLEVKAQTVRGQTKMLDYEQMTVGQWLDLWYETNEKKWKDTTKANRINAINNRLKPLIGHYKLQKLDRYTYQRAFINALEGDYKPRSILTWHNTFKIAINAAVEEEILLRNKFTKVSIPKEDESINSNYLTEAELSLLIEDAKVNEHITNCMFILTLAFTGMRRGEALGLQWSNINLEKNTITIERSRDTLGTHTPKTKNSYRTIIVDEELMAQFKSYRLWCKELLLSEGKKITDNTFVFISRHTAEPISADTARMVLERIVQRTNINNNITLHGLRHTHATILLNREVNVKLISERLGNTPEMIHKVYGHIFKESESKVASIFSESLKSGGAKTGAN